MIKIFDILKQKINLRKGSGPKEKQGVKNFLGSISEKLVKKPKKSKKAVSEVSDEKITKGNGKVSFLTMLILMAVVPVILSIVIVSANSLLSLNSSLEKNTNDTLYIAANNLANHCRDEKISFATADRFNDYIDSLKGRNIEMTILISGTPSVSSIKNDNDYRVRDIEAGDDILNDPALFETGVYKSGVVIDGKSYYCCYEPLEVDDRMLGVVMSSIPENIIKSQTNGAVARIVIVSLILVIACSVVVLKVTRDIVKTFGVINSNISNLADGKLGNTKESKSPVRELSGLVEASKSMSHKLEDIIVNVKQASDILAKNVVDVTGLSEHNAEKAENIAGAMRELSDSTMQMADYVSGISVQMGDMDDAITNISDSVEQLNNSSGTLMMANDAAKSNISSILDSNKQAYNAVNDIASQIKETNDSIANINAAVDIILGIASKTKLLSLNASIEAARAGEAGRGFAVVADEIRKLSEQSSAGAETIRSLAQTIVEKSSRSVQLADEVYELMNAERESVSATGDSYEDLAKNIRKSAEEIAMISEKTIALTEAKKIVIENVERLSAISEQNAAGNQEVTSNVEEINADAHTIYGNCDDINAQAESLRESVAFFTI